ncbi:hypothetical protein PAXINDRAFT_99511 [Paxillus involutus ATCC 200175]|uniref:Unplaced genomic scaffold PAXINscaffold_14, whole genome shotgun sequence n=1 Tax=Paxillus involutus ATCC 200175 TaxID=664439 RepID=A0A0C9U8I5_PAXIN|nr:hypothetical protein PAXINDRAFT_99511 [Paxillus involutus ATCC 200175]
MDGPSDAAASQSAPLKLSPSLHAELSAILRGDVYLRDDPNFLDYAKMFNGDVKVAALAVACPLDAQDVSQAILFCQKRSLSLSVKAGGYGTAGWAVGGDIILDLSKIKCIEIEAPKDGGGFTSIRNMPQPGSKGKGKAGPLISDNTPGGKRRREDDATLRIYTAACQYVQQFLHPGETLDSERPPYRRRLDVPALSPQSSTGTSTSSVSPGPSDHGIGSRSSPSSISMVSAPSTRSLGASTAETTPSPPSPPAKPQDSPQASTADPFGYLDDGPTQNPQPAPSTSRLAQSIPGLMFASPGFLKEIDQFSTANPLGAHSLAGGRSAVPYHIPFAAHPVGSAVMLLGGFGFLGRLHGLSMDNVVEAEVVLADGRIVIASETEHPDLWWALRGAGPAFGVVTRYKAKAFPVPVVFAGNLIYRFHRATAPSLIKHFRDCVKGAPRELYANVLLTAGPAGQDSLVVVQMCYVGPKVKGQEFLQAISSWDGERCLLNEVDEKSFLHQQDSVAQVLRGKAGNKWYIRSALINSLPDEIVNKTVLQFAETPVGCTWLFELAGGALMDFEDSCLPKSQRQAAFNVAALHQWDIDFDDPRCIESAEEWIAETLTPVTIGGPLPSFLGRHEPPGRVIACFGENWTRLREVKQTYDPTNFFRNSFWPLNSKGDIVEPEEHEPEHMQF